jgi:hypothetical protein
MLADQAVAQLDHPPLAVAKPKAEEIAEVTGIEPEEVDSIKHSRYAQTPHLRTRAVIPDLGGLTRNCPSRRAVPKNASSRRGLDRLVLVKTKISRRPLSNTLSLVSSVPVVPSARLALPDPIWLAGGHADGPVRVIC